MTHGFRPRAAARGACLLCLLLAIAGCESINKARAVKDPVAPPPPTRYANLPKDSPAIISTADPREAALDEEKNPSIADHSPDTRPKNLGLAQPPDNESANPATFFGPATPVSARPAWNRSKDASASAEVASNEVTLDEAASTEEAGAQVEQTKSLAPEGKVVMADVKHPQMAEKLDVPDEETVEQVSSGEVAALVNGVPIFMDDVLAPYARFLSRLKPHVTPQEYQAKRREAAMRDIDKFIVRQLLIHALTSKLKEEQIKGFEKAIDARFDEENVKNMMKKAKLNTVEQLDDMLRADGTSLEQQRLEYRNQIMAHEYVVMKATKKAGYDRPDLLAYYQEHLADFEYPGQVKWQQIVLDPAKHGGREKTRELAAQIIDDLKEGKDFGDLAKKYSSGATAPKGGVWPWTREGSLAREDIEEKLFQMPIGKPSEPIDGPSGIEIVRVIDRQDAGRQSFESVQGKIKTAILNESVRKGELTLVKELRSKAVIEILFDKNIVYGEGQEESTAEEESPAAAN